MRAVKYGVTRHQVLGLQAVLGTGESIRTGGKFVKSTAGYDLTQLIVGSEGTLALVTEAILRLYPRPSHAATVLAPFASLPACMSAVPKLIRTGVGPLMVEYIDRGTMAALAKAGDLELGVPAAIKGHTFAYLVVVLENTREDRLAEDTELVANLLGDLEALDVYVLPPQAGAQLIAARERAFWVAKAVGADDILDDERRQALVRTLVAGGVDTCFMQPRHLGDALRRGAGHGPEMRGVLCLFEGVATGAADGYGRMAGGRPRCCCTSAPAWATGWPTCTTPAGPGTPAACAIVGDHATYHKRFDAPLESDIDALAGTVSGWVRRSMPSADAWPPTRPKAVAAAC
jgi:FAD/FMN-containing dehydrogenase